MTLHTVGLPPERFAQLKRLAEIEGVTMSDQIADFLDAAIENDRLPDELPGWRVEREGANVMLAHAEAGLAKRMPRSIAADIGSILRAMATPAGRARGHLDLDVLLAIRRKGTGILITDAETHAERSVSPNVADNLGRRLERAAR